MCLIDMSNSIHSRYPIWTHARGTPWAQTDCRKRHALISDESIEKYYKRRVREST